MPQTYTVGARSRFVTATAWLFILLSLGVVVSTGVRYATANALPAPAAAEGLLLGWLTHALPWLMGAALLVALATLAAAIGLLMRLDGARRAFIGLMGVAIVANLGGLLLQQLWGQWVLAASLHQAGLAPMLSGWLGPSDRLGPVLGVATAVLACAALAAIIRRLRHPMVRQEFA